MARNLAHAMLPRPTHDERSRQEFIVSVKQELNRSLRSSQKRLFEEVVAPEHERD